MTKTQHPAEQYNKIRRIIFNQADKDMSIAEKWLNGYRKTLSPNGYAGLSAELEFYKSHRKDFDLIPTLDYGDATDFAGQIEGTLFRIDVTTNLSYKKLDSYEPYLTNGAKYKIAVFDKKDFELVDINFPVCLECHIGRIFNMALLHGHNYKSKNPTYTYNQSMIDICGSCGKYSISRTITSHNLLDFGEEYSLYREMLDNGLWQEEDQEQAQLKIQEKVDAHMKEYAVQALKYLKKEFSTFLVAAGTPGYRITDPDGGGYYEVQPSYVENLVEGRLVDEFEYDYYDLPPGQRGKL